MCGLIGIISFAESVSDHTLLTRGRDAMLHRGPDAAGEWWSEDGCIGLGHRRLAIVDLDARAIQPMCSSDGRYVIVFNGEIYNFRELRMELEASGAVFRTTSDTEVLLALYARRGAAMLPLLRGMFAFAIWDIQTRKLFLARDPYGIKPFYIANTVKGILFGSQVKALLATGLVARAPDPLGKAGFWLLGSVPEPHTWFRDIRALPAGHYTFITAEGVITEESWWDIGQEWREAEESKLPRAEVQERVGEFICASVRAHLVADVPVGVFLSGGIDSGTLAALMVQEGVCDLQGITLSFREFEGSDEDEAPIAAKLARHYGIKHHIRVVTCEEFESDLPRILKAMDQPSIDGINTWYASKAVAELGLKVVVSGVGGDELFQGYPSFSQLPRMVSFWSRFSRLPGALSLSNRVCSWQALRTANPRWALLPKLANSIEGSWFLRRGLFSPDELSDLMGAEEAVEEMKDITPENLVCQMTGPLADSFLLAVGQMESMVYLRNQLLRDSDWASMDHSVELRTPLVDAWLLRDLKPYMGSFEQYPHKKLLAASPDLLLPKEIIVRKKTGFGVPIRQWLTKMGYEEARQSMSRGWAKQLVKGVYRKN
ncbi:MAG: asparagine synthase (glutamine-hydrolyzing) [Desulfobulbaceae bacterium]|nr:asparagine synthase (glutamine-hydrolyzing) [Desulfobulbaceae bacterium]